MSNLLTNLNGDFLHEAEKEAKKRHLSFEVIEPGLGGGSWDVELTGKKEDIISWVKEWYETEDADIQDVLLLDLED